jgi:hypothetical protein
VTDLINKNRGLKVLRVKTQQNLADVSKSSIGSKKSKISQKMRIENLGTSIDFENKNEMLDSYRTKFGASPRAADSKSQNQFDQVFFTGTFEPPGKPVRNPLSKSTTYVKFNRSKLLNSYEKPRRKSKKKIPREFDHINRYSTAFQTKETKESFFMNTLDAEHELAMDRINESKVNFFTQSSIVDKSLGNLRHLPTYCKLTPHKTNAKAKFFSTRNLSSGNFRKSTKAKFFSMDRSLSSRRSGKIISPKVKKFQ